MSDRLGTLKIKTCLIHEPDEQVASQIVSFLKEIMELPPAFTPDLSVAIEKLKEFPFDLVVTSLHTPNGGAAILGQVAREQDETRQLITPVLVTSGKISGETASLVNEMGVAAICKIPILSSDFAAKLLDLLGASAGADASFSSESRDLLRSIANNDAKDVSLRIQEMLVNHGRQAKILALSAKAKLAFEGPASALALCEEILIESPAAVSVLNLKWKCLLALGKTEEASLVMEKTQSLSPQNISRLCAMGEVRLSEGHASVAETKFRKALELYPASQAAKAGLANALAEQGRSTEAAKVLETMEDGDEVIGGLNLKAVALVGVGEFDRAITLYKSALALAAPTFGRRDALIYNFALCCYRAGRTTEAEKLIENLLTIVPNHAKAMSLKTKISSKIPPDPAKLVSGTQTLMSDETLKGLVGQSAPSAEATANKSNLEGSAAGTEGVSATSDVPPAVMVYKSSKRRYAVF